jgi:hypothetical protein
MHGVTQTLIFLLYPMLLASRLLNALFRRDPLRLREPVGKTCWIVRKSEATLGGYFSEASVVEGLDHRGMGRLARVPLMWLARLHAPRHCASGEPALPTTGREQGIPDQIYTLW